MEDLFDMPFALLVAHWRQPRASIARSGQGEAQKPRQPETIRISRPSPEGDTLRWSFAIGRQPAVKLQTQS